MFKLLFERLKHYKKLSFIAIFILTAIAATYLVDLYFQKTINTNWESISKEKDEKIRDECFELFNKYQVQTIDFSSKILNNKKFISAFGNLNTKKSYEALFELEQVKDYNVEVYNSRLELFLYSGRQLNPDAVDLMRAVSGQRFSTVKEIGFFTYSVVFAPIISDSSYNNQSLLTQSQSDGVLVTAKLIDIQYEIKNKFFKNFGITQEIFKKYGTVVDFEFKQYSNFNFLIDSSTIKEKSLYELKNTNGEIIGQIYIPRPEKLSYIEDVSKKFSVLISVELFLLNIIVLIILLSIINNNKSYLLKTFFVAFVLSASRYFWLVIDFPSKLFNDMQVEIFSPSFYASTFALGIAKSIGELLITSIIVLIICLYIVIQVVKFFKGDYKISNLWLNIVFMVTCIAVFFFSLQLYGQIIQSFVFDSNLKYMDRTQIISTNQFELLCVQFAILLVSISLILILLSSGLVLSKLSGVFFSPYKIIKKNIVLLVFLVILTLNLIIEFFFNVPDGLSLKLSLRNTIIILAGLFTFYLHRQLTITRNYKFTSLLNFSIIILICIIFIPNVLLNKITSQENKYIELIARKVSEQASDKIRFTIMSSLEDISDNPDLELDLTNKNKFPKLAFNIWSESKLSSENLNSAVFILNTSKELISDFNINPADLNSDTIINFAIRNLNITKKDFVDLDEDDSEAEEGDEGSEQDITETSELIEIEDVIENKEMKYYYGIRPIEKIDLKNSKFRRIVGYVIIAADYDSKHFLPLSSIVIFKNISRDNVENKLISTPIISEFSDGELVSSSDKEVSKTFIKSISLFKESVKDRIDKSAWRYDEFENEIYKSFYILISQGGLQDNNFEKIYVVSSKINDFSLTAFFVFKYLLFTVVIYLIFLLFYFSYKVIEYIKLPIKKRRFNFGYREKLFASFFIVSVIPIVILAVYTREFVENKNTEFYNEQILSDLKLIDQYIKNKIPSIDQTKKLGSPEYLTNLTNIFGKDFSESHKNFNLFVKTKLASTTNPELYKSDLLDARISGNAYYNIALLKKDFFVENQEIGTFKFIVGYKPVYDSFNNLIGITSSQTVFKQYEINQELTESLVYIFGTYFVTVIFLIIIVNILSYRISNPIIKLLKATEQLSKGNVEIQVKSKSKDEIGELVKSFNKMTKELKRSRDELKKVERESAWRDIARQVAHEIKNPLTPMKLAMQHLYRAYNKNSKDFKSILQTTNSMIIDQIETLNRIATEFSDFARMPSRNYQPLNVDNILSDVVKLLNTDNKIIFKNEKSIGDAEVLGDKDEVQRALINIIRNSLQAIDEKVDYREKGFVTIESHMDNGYYKIQIKDNGVGMDEDTLDKLFEPYFSTKSKGMGLGLVITRKIIDDMRGKILVRSKLNKGTEVEIKLKILVSN